MSYACVTYLMHPYLMHLSPLHLSGLIIPNGIFLWAGDLSDRTGSAAWPVESFEGEGAS